MKKIFTTLLLLSISLVQLWAAPVDRTKALQAAQAFLASKGIALKTNLNTAYRAPRKGAPAQSQAASYYIFANGQGGGFVVVSGDDRTPAILGYSDSGTFDESNMPDNMRAWLQTYADQIEALDSQADKVTVRKTKSRKASQATSHSVAPLLTTTWDQGTPYNNLCPDHPSGEKTVTGCVATAMAQMMYHHRAASATSLLKATDAYTTKSVSISVPSYPAGSPINWNDMIDDYSKGYTEAQGTAVAQLMAYVGSALHMDYNIGDNGGSGAAPEQMAYALKQHFGYDASTKLIYRNSYDIESWEKRIYDELQANCPVVYGGGSSKGGHAFVIDGFDGDELFHVNWGWSGQSNGYFLLSILNPNNTTGIGASSSSDGYSIEQAALVGARPATTSTTFHVPELSAQPNNVENGNIHYTFANISTKNMYSDLGIGYIDSNNNIVLLKNKGYDLQFGRTGIFPDISFNLSYSAFPEDGTYDIFPIYKPQGSTEWYLCDTDDHLALTATRQGTSLAINDNNIYYSGTESINITSITFPGAKMVKVEQPVKVSITNNGDEYNGVLYCFASTSSTKGEFMSRTGLAMKPGRSQTIDMAFTPETAGTYNVWICTDEDGTNVLAQSTVTITEASSEKSLNVSSFTLNNLSADGTTIYGNDISGSIVITNTGSTAFSGDIIVFLMASDTQHSSYKSVDHKLPKLSLAANESTTIDFKFNNHGLNRYYVLQLIYNTNGYPALNGGISSVYLLEPGVTVYKADGTSSATKAGSSITIADDVVAVDFAGLTGIESIEPNQNPNVLYYFDSASDVPSALTGNIVCGETAGTINLDDQYAFYVPKTFTAQSACYKRTNTIGTNGTGGWETMVLPFDVNDGIYQDSRKLDWFKADGEKDKNLWVMDFARDQDGTVVFGYASSIEANRPYIIAVPYDRWGEEWNLVGKELSFRANNVTILSEAIAATGSANYVFKGTTIAKQLTSAYLMNSEGTAFLQTDGEAKPFRAYFVGKNDAANAARQLSIYIDDDTPTAIALPNVNTAQPSAIFNLSGMKVGQTSNASDGTATQNLPKGIYIINGKKIVK